jgi:hypothetical protein
MAETLPAPPIEPSTADLFGDDGSDSDSDDSNAPTSTNQPANQPPVSDVAPAVAELRVVETPLINDDDEKLVYTKVSSAAQRITTRSYYQCTFPHLTLSPFSPQSSNHPAS